MAKCGTRDGGGGLVVDSRHHAARLLGIEWTHEILGLEAATGLARLLSVVAKRNAGTPVPRTVVRRQPQIPVSYSRVPWLPRARGSEGRQVVAGFGLLLSVCQNAPCVKACSPCVP